MPIGVFLCFSPIVLAWVLASGKRPPERETDRHR
jgi:hypothetical protein